MNEKNLPDDINSKTLNELTEIANKIIQNLENQKVVLLEKHVNLESLKNQLNVNLENP